MYGYLFVMRSPCVRALYSCGTLRFVLLHWAGSRLLSHPAFRLLSSTLLGLEEGFDHDPEVNRLHLFGQYSPYSISARRADISAHRADSAMPKDPLTLRSDHQNVSGWCEIQCLVGAMRTTKIRHARTNRKQLSVFIFGNKSRCWIRIVAKYY